MSVHTLQERQKEQGRRAFYGMGGLPLYQLHEFWVCRRWLIRGVTGDPRVIVLYRAGLHVYHEERPVIEILVVRNVHFSIREEITTIL